LNRFANDQLRFTALIGHIANYVSEWGGNPIFVASTWPGTKAVKSRYGRHGHKL